MSIPSPIPGCPFADQNCCVAAMLVEAATEYRKTSNIDLTSVLQAIPDLSDCSRCRMPQYTRDNLPGLRMGRQRRKVLLEAASHKEGSPSNASANLVPRSDRESYLRAMRALAKIGLIRVTKNSFERSVRQYRRPKYEIGENGAPKVLVHGGQALQTFWQPHPQLTPFGSEIVPRIQLAIDVGSRIRWAQIDLDGAVKSATKTRTEILAGMEAKAIEHSEMLPELAQISKFVRISAQMLSEVRTAVRLKQIMKIYWANS